jgi:Fe2+ or Zn2+ uptake regulation protein
MLSVLRELGLVKKHHLGEDHGHYEGVREVPHYHFTCRRCGQVIEFDSSLVGQIEQELSERGGVRVTGMHLHVSGYCARCKDGAAR